MLVDAIVGGVLSYLCIGNTRLKATQAAVGSTNYVSQQFGKDVVEGPRPWDNLISILNRLKKSLKRDERHEA